jgi:SAM-dependent methyltransferase
MLRQLLIHPLMRELDIDDPAATTAHHAIIRRKPFLRRIYDEWYQKIVDSLPEIPGAVLEIGSGAGFLAENIPGLITTEIFQCPAVRAVLDARALPFATGSLRGIVMTNVLHHVPDARAFFEEAQRCLCSGGIIAMIEPWHSRWSRFVYTNLHHEPFLIDSPEWSHSFGGRLSGANGALPWIIFHRDRAKFEAQFPKLQIARIEPCMPFRYLVSGGLTMRTLAPSFTFTLWTWLESRMQPWMSWWAMFAFVLIVKPVPEVASSGTRCQS